MSKLYEAHKDRVVFLLVSDEGKEVVERFKKKHGYTFAVYRPLTSLPKGLEASSIPKTYILGKDGRIAVNKSGAANWNSDKVHETLRSLLE